MVFIVIEWNKIYSHRKQIIQPINRRTKIKSMSWHFYPLFQFHRYMIPSNLPSPLFPVPIEKKKKKKKKNYKLSE